MKTIIHDPETCRCSQIANDILGNGPVKIQVGREGFLITDELSANSFARGMMAAMAMIDREKEASQ